MHKRQHLEPTPPSMIPGLPDSQSDGGGHLLALWVLRALLEAGGCRALVQHGMTGLVGEHAELLGYKRPLNLELPGARAKLARRYEELSARPVRRQGELFRNVDWLGQALSLDELERELLVLAVLTERSDLLRELFHAYRFTALHQQQELLARMLAVPIEAVRKATHIEAQLARTQLLVVSVDTPSADCTRRRCAPPWPSS